MAAHAGHRLVEQQQPGLGREGHRELELAPLAVRENRDRRRRAVEQADLLERGARRRDQQRVARAERQKRKLWPAWACAASITFCCAVKSGNTDVIWYEREMPASARACIGSEVIACPALDHSRIGRQLPGQLIDQCRLSRAVGADHPHATRRRERRDRHCRSRSARRSA
jgi:hypothetical protein